MKRVDDTKDCFNLIENDEICYEEQELLCHLEPPYPTNSQMTFDFSDNDIKNIMTALKKSRRSSMRAWNWMFDWTFALVFPGRF